MREAVFSVEGKVENVREIESRATPGKKTTTIVTVEGFRFWARGGCVRYGARRAGSGGGFSSTSWQLEGEREMNSDANLPL